ncbi:MAG: methyltransferase domain-containing protein [Candidatus Lokiarchaeota archaeon]|nr:methyltransferase domain-containing protein [Candidatus Lokiarchaeota archaeon]
MKKLEEEPREYERNFTKLTKQVNIEIYNWILKRIKPQDNIIEIGCGPGTLARKIANKANNIIAYDINPKMIEYAKNNYNPNQYENLKYRLGTYNQLSIDPNSQDVIVSTFMLSELRPFEQQIFLKNCWDLLKNNGRILIAAEFQPKGFWNVLFKLNRWWFKKKLKRLRLKGTYILKHFFKYLEPIGFKIIEKKVWNHGSIQVIELKKINIKENLPGFYRPSQKNFKGIRAQLRIYRCIFTGQMDKVPKEPGLYKSGEPNENSPIIVTGNYEFTYIKLMRDLKGIDAWVLCIDSNGINVWCAARGDDFENKQLLEALEATGLHNYVKTKELILPQLSAGGIALPKLPKNSETFPYKVKYGPIWSKYLKQYLMEKKKTEKMKRIKFTLYHRIRAGLSHISFLMRKIFILPIIGLLFLNLITSILLGFSMILLIIDFISALVLSNLLLILIYPLSEFTRNFIIKGIFFGLINMILMIFLIFYMHNSLEFLLFNLPLFFWISFFSTMSFSGSTMSTNPKEIQSEYPIFKKINIILMIITLILSSISLFYY